MATCNCPENSVLTTNNLGEDICIEQVEPKRRIVNFDNTDYFKELSWTISYKLTEGQWDSYFTFYPNFSIAHQEHFQIGFNYGQDKGTMWNHTFKMDSFCVFQGRYNPFVVEFVIANENVNKILNALSVNIEARRFTNHYDYSTDKNIGISDLFIYNQTNNTGYLVLHNQKSLADNRKYPYVEGNKQHILSTNEGGKQNVNYLFNRILNQDNNIPMFQRDENNIFKTIDPRAVKFGNKKVLERIKGETMIVNLSNTKDSNYNILIKNLINNETIEE